MLALTFGILAALSTAIGLLLTKSIASRLPVWQVVGPLFLLNTILVLPAIPFGPQWILWTPRVLTLHIASSMLLIAGAGCVFLLIARGRASSVSVGRAVSPVAVLIAAPLLLGSVGSPLLVVGAIIVMIGALAPLRREFVGLGPGVSLFILIFLGLSEGVLTVLTAMLALDGVGLPEIYIVRTLAAGIFFTAIFLPRGLRPRDLKALTVRAIFVTGGYVFLILGVRDGDVLPVQSLWATAPLLTILLEWWRYRIRPHKGAIIGAVVVAAGVFLLLSVAASQASVG